MVWNRRSPQSNFCRVSRYSNTIREYPVSNNDNINCCSQHDCRCHRPDVECPTWPLWSGPCCNDSDWPPWVDPWYPDCKCPPGPPGPRGPRGPMGLMGPMGPVGPRGSQGLQGPKGNDGARGPAGQQGPKGDSGPRGPQGLQGQQGPKGDDGARGPQGLQGPKGNDGARGPQGSQGPQGPVGPRGPAGSTTTANSMFAANTREPRITVPLTGVLVHLPDAQNLDAFTKNQANTIFTVPKTGRYFIRYNIRLTAGILMGSRILINGTPAPATTVNSLLRTARYDADVILNLREGDTISLQLFGLAGVVILQGDAGASLTVIRVE